MNSSSKTGGDTQFQLPFSGLGISLKACADEAGKMRAWYSEVPTHNSPIKDFFGAPAFNSFSGYELLLTLGREIRGR